MDREGPAAAGRASRAAWRLAMIWLLALGWPLGVAAQTESARLTGIVTDATGGVLPGVTVTVVRAPTGAIARRSTDTNGRLRHREPGAGFV